MPKFINRFHGVHLILFVILCLVLIITLAFQSIFFASVSFLILVILIYYTYRSEMIFRQDFINHIKTIQYRVKKVGKDIIHDLNIGILLYDEHQKIKWNNSYLNKVIGDENLIGKKVQEIFPNININDDENLFVIEHDSNIYQMDVNYNERSIYITDITAYSSLLTKYNNEKLVIGIIHFDNLDEISQDIDDLSQSLLLTDVTSIINDWANSLDIYIKKFSSDKFVIITNNNGLKQLEETSFDILDKVREITKSNKIPLTLSIGMGVGLNSVVELGELAQTSLDIALGRGGDQAVVKIQEKLVFYGGKSNAVEKRTRVRARVISHALRDLINESDLVVIMGHNNLDMDAIGSAIGILKAVHINGKKGYVIIEENNPMIKNLLDEINKNSEYSQYFVTPEHVYAKIDTKTLLVIVDTHRTSLTIDPVLIERIDRVVIIDHHRRGKEIVENSLLNYIEPYASSASELVTELLQYQSDKLEFNSIESTALLSGIVVDTGSFTYRTGYRTFEAASFLRMNGADPILVQKVLKEDLEVFIKRAELLKNTKKVLNNIALLVADEKLDQVQIAQLADTLMEMSGVLASFVISRRTDELISISARSLGEINVQVIMESLGGGGHLTNASTQIEGISLNEAEIQLMDVLKDIQVKGD